MGTERGRRVRRRLSALGVAMAVAAAVAVVVPGAAGATAHDPVVGAAASYRTTDLGAGYDYDSRAHGFGPGGLIAGWVTVGFENRSAIWPRGRTRAEVIGPATSSPLVVSARGEVFSQVVPSDPAGTTRVVRWWRGVETPVANGSAGTALADGRGRVLLRIHGPEGTEVRLIDGTRSQVVTGLPDPLPPSPPSPEPREPYIADLNDRGAIVGTIDRDATADDAFVWRDGTTTYLPALPDAGPPEHARAVALGIDERGVIVGYSSTDDGTAVHPVLWRRGRVVDLGVPPGFASCYVSDWSGPLATGWVVGSCYRTPANVDAQPFVWHRGTYTVLPTLGGASVHATAVNSRGVVAGVSDLLVEGQHAVAWRDGRAVDLGTLGGANSQPADIDEHGRVVGTAELANGRNHAVLWTPRR